MGGCGPCPRCRYVNDCGEPLCLLCGASLEEPDRTDGQKQHGEE